MTLPLSFLRQEYPDVIDLELRLAGVPVDAQQEAILDQAAAGPLASELTELKAFDAWWQQNAPELPSKVVPLRRSHPLIWVATAAALVLGLLWLSPVEQSGIRAMGSIPVDLQVDRQGQQVRPTAGNFQAGDRLAISFVAPHAGRVHVGTVQDDGQGFLLWSSPWVAQGQRVALDKAILLDNHGGKEWLVVTIVSQPQDRQGLEANMRAAASTGGNEHSWIYEVSRGH